ncbi:ATP-binding protein [Oerskovia turbata]|uniref:ATP-binding protein n=2 Tax=Oerskovia turbata TaxID=1713 RepID=A0A4Q1L0X9_9CELL|nr:ATP-binding protein [Oerskovia turbata]RXR36300.1 ATP-binding protein [Oerskovia turbata]TGJ98153.1 ATP-binding protein [Actinotalea fermentans ATCC 43279 = JCM 9966 = DSM 3133]
MGQVLTRATKAGDAVGHGRVLGELRPDGTVVASGGDPFTSHDLTPAGAGVLEALQARERATLRIGELHHSRGKVDALLQPHRFNRHTFLCGQSGSGKTYALGVLLEQLLIDTDLPMVILDPNSDFVRISELLESASPDDAARLRGLDVRVLRNDGDHHPVTARLTAMEAASQAAVLQLDPLTDRGEYNTFLRMLESAIGPDGMVEEARAAMKETGPAAGAVLDPHTIATALRDTGESDALALAQRVENLGVLDWDVWAGVGQSVSEVLDEGPRAVVVDLGSLHTHEEQLAVSLALLDHLWAGRAERKPRLIVIDEAHNVVSAEPATQLQRLTTERVVQIAAEGRKFGLWLLLSTQRPSKIHPNVLSQCDNVIVMRMSSPADLAELEAVYGFAPPELLAATPFFRQGEALVAGGFVPAPAIIQMGARRTVEGGSDVPVPMPG